MPKIIISEKDYTTPGIERATNFAVVVPGFIAKAENVDAFDENGIYECESASDFIDDIGAVAPTKITINNIEAFRGQYFVSYGNQIAYELLSLGYPVLYLNLGYYDGQDTSTVEPKIQGLLDGSLLEALKDKANYNFRFIITGLCSGSSDQISRACANSIIKLAAFYEKDTQTDGKVGDSVRGDVIALVDIEDTQYTSKTDLLSVIDAIQRNADGYFTNVYKEVSKYAAIVVPTLCFKNLASKNLTDDEGTRLYLDTSNDVNNKMPGSFYYLACFARSVKYLEFAEWYAAAGYTRGISELTVDSTSVKLGESAINLLEPRYKIPYAKAAAAETEKFTHAVNVIADFRGNYILWGNRTAYPLGTKNTEDGDLIASHFLNIRQLCTTLKKDIYQACRRFTFDPNSDVLWINFCNALRPTLEAMKADQGIQDYEIIKVATDKKATLKARVRIVPIEAVEDFDIEVSLEDSLGGGVTATISE